MSSMSLSTYTSLVAVAAGSWCVQGLDLAAATHENRQPSFDRQITKPEEGK